MSVGAVGSGRFSEDGATSEGVRCAKNPAEALGVW